MAVAEATGDAEKIIEQVMIERLLDGVISELRAWLKEQKPKSAEELGNLANLHVQSRKGPLVGASMYQSAGSLGKRNNQTIRQMILCPKKNKSKTRKGLQSPPPFHHEGIQDLKLYVSNVVNWVTCHLIVVGAVGSLHRRTCCA